MIKDKKIENLNTPKKKKKVKSTTGMNHYYCSEKLHLSAIIFENLTTKFKKLQKQLHIFCKNLYMVRNLCKESMPKSKF